MRQKELKTQSQFWDISQTEIDRLPEFPDPDGFSALPTFSVKWSDPKCRIVCAYIDGAESELIADVATGTVNEWGGAVYEKAIEDDGIVRIEAKAWGLVGSLKIGSYLKLELDGKSHRCEIGRRVHLPEQLTAE